MFIVLYFELLAFLESWIETMGFWRIETIILATFAFQLCVHASYSNLVEIKSYLKCWISDTIQLDFVISVPIQHSDSMCQHLTPNNLPVYFTLYRLDVKCSFYSLNHFLLFSCAIVMQLSKHIPKKPFKLYLLFCCKSVHANLTHGSKSIKILIYNQIEVVLKQYFFHFSLTLRKI